MSYRSLKRVLGETGLERKCLFLFGACLLLLITGSFWWYGRQTEQLVDKQNPVKAEYLLKSQLNFIHYNYFAKTLKETDDWSDFVKSLTEEVVEDDYQSRFIKARRVDESTLDPAELAMLRHFQAVPMPQEGESTAYEEAYGDGGGTYEYYRPFYAFNPQCLSCHRIHDPTLAYGELLGVGKVVLSTTDTNKELAWNRAMLISTAIITVFLAMIASYIIVRYVIVKPLKHLRDVSDAISHGQIDQRAEIHTGDEFEEMANAFNRMMRHLMTVQSELRDVNHNLDGKVDELAQVNMRLFEMNRLKSDFLATMSHELRTPLNSIIGFSDVLGSISSLDEKQRRYVQNIQKSGKMLLDMINDILDLAKIESGKMEIRAADFRLDHIIHAQCDMARPLTEKKNIDLLIDVEPRLPNVHQDQGKLQQILNNLLSNAIKFTPEGGRIVVGARLIDDTIHLTVADTGVGIAEEDQVSIFEKFRQGATALPGGDAMTREYSGTGLGLSIVKELCKLLGGEISVESHLGKGSTFTVRLPAKVAASAKLDAA